MAESTIPSTGDPRVDAALERIRGKFSDLEDAMIVQSQLEKRMSERIKEHAEFIATHEAASKQHEAWIQKHDQTISEIDGKLNALIDIVMRREGGSEARR